MKGKSNFRIIYTLTIVLALGTTASLQGVSTYQRPPQAMLDILNAPSAPTVSISPARDRILLIEDVRHPSIADLARPMLRLAGERINPNTNGPHQPRRIKGISILKIADGSLASVALPAGTSLSNQTWSADGKQVALLNTTGNAVELWILDVETAKLRKIPGVAINAAFGEPLQWMPDQRTLLVQMVPPGRGKAPAAPGVPQGPTIQENQGGKAPVWTFEDLLKNKYDEMLFDYYCTAQLGSVDVAGGKFTAIGKPGIFPMVDAAPDGKMLLVARLNKPYSYLVTSNAFPREVEVWNRAGAAIYKLASLPLQDVADQCRQTG